MERTMTQQLPESITFEYYLSVLRDLCQKLGLDGGDSTLGMGRIRTIELTPEGFHVCAYAEPKTIDPATAGPLVSKAFVPAVLPDLVAPDGEQEIPLGRHY
jgi:hypothetical protein